MTTASPRALATVALLAAALAGCGGSGDREAQAGERLEEVGGVRASFAAEPERRGAILRLLQDRIAARDVDAFAEASGSGRIVLTVADESPEKARETIRTLTALGRVAFYDWEANVIGPDGGPAPADLAVTGGPNAGKVTGLPLYDAVLRAARRPAVDDGDNSHTGVWYVLEPGPRDVEGPFARRADAVAARSAGRRLVRVEAGTVLLRSTDRAGWFVLADNPALGNEDIVDPRQEEDPRNDREPIVAFELTDDARERFQALTRELAQRGARHREQGAKPLDAVQHFAIALDDELISVPFIDYQANPDGIDAEHGSQIQGGFTEESAQALAALLRAGPLPPGALTPSGEEVVRPAG